MENIRDPHRVQRSLNGVFDVVPHKMARMSRVSMRGGVGGIGDVSAGLYVYMLHPSPIQRLMACSCCVLRSSSASIGSNGSDVQFNFARFSRFHRTGDMQISHQHSLVAVVGIVRFVLMCMHIAHRNRVYTYISIERANLVSARIYVLKMHVSAIKG